MNYPKYYADVLDGNNSCYWVVVNPQEVYYVFALFNNPVPSLANEKDLIDDKLEIVPENRAVSSIMKAIKKEACIKSVTFSKDIIKGAIVISNVEKYEQEKQKEAIK